MAALKESRKRRRRQDLDVPTWTGKSGTAGAPKAFLQQQQQSSPKQRFGTANTFNPSVASAVSSGDVTRFGRGAAGVGASRLQPGIGASSSTSGTVNSSSLLAGMLERKRLEQGGSSSSRSQTSSRDPSPPASIERHVGPSILQDGSQEGLILKIRDYMMEHGGRVRSADLIGHFQDQLADVEQLVFKKMLKGIAVLERSSLDGQGWWKLKADYY